MKLISYILYIFRRYIRFITPGENFGLPYLDKATVAARAALPSLTSICVSLFFTYCAAMRIMKAGGNTSPPVVHFPLPRGLWRVRPEAHGLDMSFVLIQRTWQSARFHCQTQTKIRRAWARVECYWRSDAMIQRNSLGMQSTGLKICIQPFGI